LTLLWPDKVAAQSYAIGPYHCAASEKQKLTSRFVHNDLIRYVVEACRRDQIEYQQEHTADQYPHVDCTLYIVLHVAFSPKPQRKRTETDLAEAVEFDWSVDERNIQAVHEGWTEMLESMGRPVGWLGSATLRHVSGQVLALGPPRALTERA